MYEAASLTDKKVLSEPVSLVVADIDYTLVDFDRAHWAAIAAIGQKLGDSLAQSVNDIFLLINEEHQQRKQELWPIRREFEKLILKIKNVQKFSNKEYGLKKWSRESWMVIYL